MQFLRGAIGTSKISDGFVNQLKRLLEENPEEEYDLAACVISKGIANVIENNPKRFVDTADSVRNAILGENRYVAENAHALVELPTFNPVSGPSMKDLIQSLSPEEFYSIPFGDFSFAALVLLTRPEINVVPLTQTGQFGEYLRRHLYKSKSIEIDTPVMIQLRETYPNFLVYKAKRVDEVVVDDFSITDMYHGRPHIPSAYGTEKLNRHPLWEEFKRVVVQELVVSHAPGLTVSNFIKKGLA